MIKPPILVSTHSRAEAAAQPLKAWFPLRCGFNTQPRGGGCILDCILLIFSWVSTHSRAEAAARSQATSFSRILMFQHTAARRRLLYKTVQYGLVTLFQHTAARRRLPLASFSVGCLSGFQHTAARRRLHIITITCFIDGVVSTHSRAEAAAVL